MEVQWRLFSERLQQESTKPFKTQTWTPAQEFTHKTELNNNVIEQNALLDSQDLRFYCHAILHNRYPLRDDTLKL